MIFPTTPEEVEDIITNLDNSKSSSDPYNIPLKLLKVAIKPISKAFCKVVNNSFISGVFPDLLKFGCITPIHKNDSKLLISNYRPISVLPLFSKIIEKLMKIRLVSFLSKQNTIFEHQFGFQKNKSTNFAILDIYNKLISSFETKKLACCIFLDFAKAFDTVDHTILIKKLRYYGVRGVASKWFESYLTNRSQVTKIGQKLSPILTILCGVPQGSVLGPILFLLYINDIFKSSNILQFHLFADDTSIYYSNDDVNQMEKTINEELKNVSDWLNSNRLSLNVKKSSYILFHPPQKKN